MTVFGDVFWKIRSKYEILPAENWWQVASWKIWHFHQVAIWFWLGFLQMNCSKMSPWSSPTGITQFGYVFWEIRSKYEVISARFCVAVHCSLENSCFIICFALPFELQFVKTCFLKNHICWSSEFGVSPNIRSCIKTDYLLQIKDNT